MRALLQRLSGLDDVESAVRIIELFDKLAQDRLGLDDLVRSAALFSECSAGVTDADGTVIVRVSSDGRRLAPHRPESATAHEVGGGGEVWLERDGSPPTLDALVLERFATAVAIARKRKRDVLDWPGGSNLVELMIRRTTDEADRLLAIERFGLIPASPIRTLAIAPSNIDLPPSFPSTLGRAVVQEMLAVVVHGDEDVASSANDVPAGVRVGVGPCVPAIEAWSSWHAARLAARFADGVRGPASPVSAPHANVVIWEDLGGLTALAEYVPPDAISAVPDVASLDRLAAERTGAVTLTALRALCETDSIRVAARALHMHHSSVGQRLDHAEKVLGFSVRTAPGHTRLAVALALRRLRETAQDPSVHIDDRYGRQLAGSEPENTAARH